MTESNRTSKNQVPERPVAWYRWGGSALAPIMAWGDWPPPEPDDVVWHPLYSTPEGRPADETTERWPCPYCRSEFKTREEFQAHIECMRDEVNGEVAR